MLRIEMKGLRKAVTPILVNWPKKKRLTILKKALRAAGRVLASMLKKYSPIRSGTMRKSMTHKVKYYQKSDTLLLLVGVKSHYSGTWNGKKVVPHRYGHFVTGGRKGFTQRLVIKPGRSLKLGKGFTIRNNGKSNIVFNRYVGSAGKNNFMMQAFGAGRAKALQAATAKVQAEWAKVVASGGTP